MERNYRLTEVKPELIEVNPQRSSPVQSVQAKTNGCPHGWPAGPSFCPECNPRPTIGGSAPKPAAAALAPTKKLGFDPHTINKPMAGYSVEQIQKIVRYHWDESENRWWRDNTRSEDFFERNLEKMANAIPVSWLNPQRVGKKSFLHPKPGLKRV